MTIPFQRNTSKTLFLQQPISFSNEEMFAKLTFFQNSNIWFTASFKNDARIIAKAAELHEDLVKDLTAFIPDGDFITQCLFQPLPTLFGQRTLEAGGNIMGVER